MQEVAEENVHFGSKNGGKCYLFCSSFAEFKLKNHIKGQILYNFHDDDDANDPDFMTTFVHFSILQDL